MARPRATEERPPSDLDLVVYVSPEDLDLLDAFFAECYKSTHPPTARATRCSSDPGDSDVGGVSDGGPRNGSYRFGPLNLIAVTDPTSYRVWRDGCRFLKAKAPVDRQRAIQYYRKKRKRAGVSAREDG